MMVDGDVVGRERSDNLDYFRRDARVRALLMTYKVGSEGLNLTKATHCICIEPWWTPAVHTQAEARCWRSGQTQPVTIYNVLVADSIEGRIMTICGEKDELAANYLDGARHRVSAGSGLNKHTLGRILGLH